LRLSHAQSFRPEGKKFAATVVDEVVSNASNAVILMNPITQSFVWTPNAKLAVLLEKATVLSGTVTRLYVESSPAGNACCNEATKASKPPQSHMEIAKVWKPSHELYINHVTDCTACRAPQRRYCDEGAQLWREYWDVHQSATDPPGVDKT
jgi:hypothetical protein